MPTVSARSILTLTRAMWKWLVSGVALIAILWIIYNVWGKNQSYVTVSLWGYTFERQLGVVLTAAFICGAVFASLVAFVIAVRQLVLEWKVARRQKIMAQNNELLASGREQFVSGNFSGAHATFKKIVNQDAGNTVARALLAETLRAQGDRKAALQVVDQGRVLQKENLELLFLAADLNQELGNNTAARDNVELVLKRHPQSVPALRRLVACENALGRPEQAAEHQRTIIKLSKGEARKGEEQNLVGLEVESARKKAENLPAAEAARLMRDSTRQYREHPLALRELAFWEARAGNGAEAEKFLQRAYEQTHDVQLLVDYYSWGASGEQLGKTLASIDRILLKDQAPESASGHLFLANAYLNHGLLDESERVLGKLDSLQFSGDQVRVTKLLVEALRFRVLVRQGKSDRALRVSQHLVHEGFEIPGDGILGEGANSRGKNSPLSSVEAEQISPVFSTP